MKNIWSKEELKRIKKLNSPMKIQTFLNEIAYNCEYKTKSPKLVLKEKSANCFEGALFAAAMLRELGHPALIVDMESTQDDDDHVIAVFKVNNHWGAIAKSNYTTIKYREPIYRDLHELIMSYFDMYFTPDGKKTLRYYSEVLDLKCFDKDDWMMTDKDLSYIGDELNKVKHHKILTKKMEKNLSKADPLLIKAGLLGSNKKGLYKKFQ